MLDAKPRFTLRPLDLSGRACYVNAMTIFRFSLGLFLAAAAFADEPTAPSPPASPPAGAESKETAPPPLKLRDLLGPEPASEVPS